MQLGLVTYMWGAEWDLPTLVKNLEETGFAGVELRSGHKHGVEPSISAAARRDVAKRFEDSPVELVGFGSACEFHSPDPAVLKKNIDETKAFIQLCHDCGGTGVKVRPNGLPAEVPVPKTLEQIGRALNETAAFGADFGVEIRLEVHGRGTSELPHIRTIMDVADQPGAVVCWNCNPADLSGEGLEHNFNLVKNRLGTIHIHDLVSEYPWAELFALLKGANFDGWTLLEEGAPTGDPIRVMKYYRQVWETLAS
ncbi:MAG: sugar phosphate isomerase/epimerase [Pirellulales bacterium]|nr:sugar phosphate isomerase/epimerase [Pirellulales bacterium]